MVHNGALTLTGLTRKLVAQLTGCLCYSGPISNWHPTCIVLVRPALISLAFTSWGGRQTYTYLRAHIRFSLIKPLNPIQFYFHTVLPCGRSLGFNNDLISFIRISHLNIISPFYRSHHILFLYLYIMYKLKST